MVILIFSVWLLEIRLLLFLILVEFSVFLGTLRILPEWGIGGEAVVIFIISGSVLRLLLLVVSNSGRKFGIYSTEIYEYKLYRLLGSYPRRIFYIVRVSWNFFIATEKERYVPVLLSSWILISVPALYLRFSENASHGFLLRSLGLISIFLFWVSLVLKEADNGGITLGFRRRVRFAFILFIASEVAFFGSFFWGFYTFSLIPTLEIGRRWPQEYVRVIDGLGVPLLNTVILLSSGVRVTWAHKALLHGKNSFFPLLLTVGLGLVFLAVQVSEYASASFRISDGVYGRVFFLLTGFHGFHVLVGCIILTYSLFRSSFFSRSTHVGFECAAWYWHFVDVVWLFLFSFIYLWRQGIFSHLSE